MLDYFGDLGGLFGALYRTCLVLIAPLTGYSFKGQLMLSIFGKKSKTSSKKPQFGRKYDSENSLEQYKSRIGVHNSLLCLCHPKSVRYRRLLKIS